MFDNLRQQADSNSFEDSPFDATPFYEDEGQFREAEQARPAPKKARRAARVPSSGGRFLGMTPFQRFALAFMLFITVCVLGAMLLLVTGRLGLM